jgi:drug/metabolite transporter (DMT)-like permease
MLWVILALSAALSLAISDALLKKTLADGNEYRMAWLRLLFALPLLAVTLVFMEKPPLDAAFFRAFIISLPLEIIALVFYVKSIRVSPLSLVLPFLALTPLFQIIFGYLILNESVTARGVIGIFLMAAGSYTLNLSHVKKGALEPFNAIFREKGSRLMIAVALIYSITSALGKAAILHSSPLYFGSTYFITVALAFTPLMLWKGNREWAFPKNHSLKYAALAGFFYSIMVISHMLAISMAKAAYMIAVKRTSVLFGVVLGRIMFEESHIRERFLGALLMLIGLVLIAGAA